MYKAVGFDLGGVILYYSIPDQLRDLARTFGVPEDKIQEAFRRLRPPLDTGEITNQQFWSQLLEAVEADVDPGQTEYLWSKDYIRQNPFLPGTMNLIERLKEADYKVGLLSNIDREHAEINYGRHIFEHFDTVLLSDEIHVRKPDAESYRLLAARLGVDIDELVFIDDSPYNVDGANRVGAMGILFEGYQPLARRLAALGLKF